MMAEMEDGDEQLRSDALDVDSAIALPTQAGTQENGDSNKGKDNDSDSDSSDESWTEIAAPEPGASSAATLRAYFKSQETTIAAAIAKGDHARASKLAIKALRGPPALPLYYRCKWAAYLALLPETALHLRRYYVQQWASSLKRLEEANDNVRYVREAVVPDDVQPLAQEYSFLATCRELMDECFEKIDNAERRVPAIRPLNRHRFQELKEEDPCFSCSPERKCLQYNLSPIWTFQAGLTTKED
ncbi:hypothetical protein BKA80DRAFT_318810 [Phyllosticta citrichinensis]